jgi:intergrase/recombinase
MSSKTPSKKKHGRDSIPKKFREQYDAELEEAMKKYEEGRNKKLMKDTEKMKKAVRQNSVFVSSPEETPEQFKERFLKDFKKKHGIVPTPTPSSTRKTSPPKVTPSTNRNKTKKIDWLYRFTPRFLRKPLSIIHEE